MTGTVANTPEPEDLDAAVAAGILDADQARKLSAFFADRRARDERDDERLLFLRSFQDIFLTIGVVLIPLGAGWWLGDPLMPNGPAALVTAAIALALAFVVVRRGRPLPMMALAAVFVPATGFSLVPATTSLASQGILGEGTYLLWLLAPPLAAFVAALAYYALFRLPFVLGLAAGAAAVLVMTATTTFAPDFTQPATLVLGLVLFATAMAFDVRDPGRGTRLSDIAFWIHLVAAPLLVHGAVQWLIDFETDAVGLGQAFTILAVLAGLALLAVIVDRRAMLVSGLVYLGYALFTLLNEATGGGAEVAVVVMLIGVIVFGLATGWRSVRRLVLGRFPRRGLLTYLPPVEAPTS